MPTYTRPTASTAGRSADAGRHRPSDLVVAWYAAISGAALAFPGRPDAWPVLAVVHALVVASALRHRSIRPALAAVTARAPRFAAFIADWYPLLLMPLAYGELESLNLAVWGGRYFDGVVMGLERMVFGGQPSLTLAHHLPWLPLSEVLHLAYLAYYPLIWGPFIVLYVTHRNAAFRTMLLPLLLGFAAHYLVFILFPVQGPRYLFPPPGGPPSEGVLYKLTHTALEAGSSRGAAFPSSHAAIAVIQAIMVARLMGRFAAVLVGVTALLLCVGAVYGGFHYAIDVLVGAVAGALIVLATRRIQGAGR